MLQSAKAKFITLASGISVFFIMTAASAQDLSKALPNVTDAGKKAGTDGMSNFGTVVGTGIQVALSLVGLIFLISMIYAGFLWMTARGEEDQVKKARTIIMGSIIGLVIVISAYAISYLVGGTYQ